MALSEVLQQQKVKGGKGGLFGKIAGTVLGGAAGFVAGGPPGAVMGAGLGGSLGGVVGDVADPAKVSEPTAVPLSRMADKPNVQLAQLVDSQKALMEAPQFTIPQKEELNQSVYVPTIAKLKQQMGIS